jgi:hypothetical protein
MREVEYVTCMTGNGIIVISEWLLDWATGRRFPAGAVLEFCRICNRRQNAFLVLGKIKSSLRMSRPT